MKNKRILGFFQPKILNLMMLTPPNLKKRFKLNRDGEKNLKLMQTGNVSSNCFHYFYCKYLYIRYYSSIIIDLQTGHHFRIWY